MDWLGEKAGDPAIQVHNSKILSEAVSNELKGVYPPPQGSLACSTPRIGI
jgi:hypothetical protein